MIKAWEFDFNQVPGKAIPNYEDQDLVQKAFDHNMELMESLEARGFEGVFYSEHHFVGSMSPCPNLLVAALAAKTETLKIGVMGNVLAFHQPWRIAEELAMLDYLTGGRHEVGVASGVPPEFEFVNIPQENIRPMYKEVLEYLEHAREQKFVTLKGDHFDFDMVPSMPRPRKEDRRRHWVTYYSADTCRDAAKRDFKIVTGYQSCESAAKGAAAYYEEAEKLGRKVGPDDIGLRRQILIWDTQSEAEAMFAENAELARARMDAMFQDVFTRLQAKGVGPSDDVLESGVMDAASVTRKLPKDTAAEEDKGVVASSLVGEDGKPIASASKALDSFISEDEYITGSPESVAEQIIDQCRRLGCGNILGYHAASLDENQIRHNYDLWEKVIPVLHKADVLGEAVSA